jgi:hypothetical protein
MGHQRKYIKKPTGAKLADPAADSLDELEDEDLAGLLDDPEDDAQVDYQLDNLLEDGGGVLTGGASMGPRGADSEDEDDDMGALADVLGELQDDEEINNTKKTKME